MRFGLVPAKSDWKLDAVPDVVMLKGENHRDRVLTITEEEKYLSACKPLLCDFATVLVDTGTRPEECFRMRWEHVSWGSGRHGALSVTHGKTDAARRILPLTPRGTRNPPGPMGTSRETIGRVGLAIAY
jgi:integrase